MHRHLRSTGLSELASDTLSGTLPITALIRREYENEAKAKGFTPSNFTESELLDKANGIAKINEGMILYFHPYNIGCGAEGQYNLVLHDEK